MSNTCSQSYFNQYHLGRVTTQCVLNNYPCYYLCLESHLSHAFSLQLASFSFKSQLEFFFHVAALKTKNISPELVHFIVKILCKSDTSHKNETTLLLFTPYFQSPLSNKETLTILISGNSKGFEDAILETGAEIQKKKN